MAAVDMDTHMQAADLVITAEGAIDGQSASGKTPTGVAKLALQYNVPVIGMAGKLGGDNMTAIHEAGITAIFSIAPAPISKNDSIVNAARYLENTSEQLARLVTRLRSKNTDKFPFPG